MKDYVINLVFLTRINVRIIYKRNNYLLLFDKWRIIYDEVYPD